MQNKIHLRYELVYIQISGIIFNLRINVYTWSYYVNSFDNIVFVDSTINRVFSKPPLSGNPFFQPPCALALLLCAWRLFRALGCGGVGEVDYRSSVLMWGGGKRLTSAIS